MTASLQGMSREEKLALLRRLREEEAASSAAASRPPEGPVRHPVSFAQRRLWFLDRLDPGSSHNNIFRALRLRGSLDEGALSRAVDALVARHGSLRTRFEATGDDPVQVVETPEAVGRVMTRVDLSGVAAGSGDGAREEALLRLAKDEAALPFDLSRAPLVRVTLVALSGRGAAGEPEDRALLVTLHHIVADGWSLALFFRELSALYEAELTGRSPELPELSEKGPSYGEIAAAQRRRLDGGGLERRMEFWRGELAGAPDVLDLPTDRPRPALGSFRGSIVPLGLSPGTTAGLEALARAERATPFMLLLAVFASVLGRWSRHRDLLVGVPIAGRDQADAEGVIGLFANTVVVRVELDGAEGAAGGFRELVRRVRRRTLDALAHQETPFESLVEELVPTRDLSRNPLFQAMFALQNMPGASLSLGAARVEPLPVERSLAKVDLTLDLRKGEDGAGRPAFRGYLEYNTDLFDRATAERLAGHVESLAEAFVAEPDRPIDDFEMAGPEERATLLAEGEGPARPAPAVETVDALFRAAAEARPDHPAIEALGPDGAVDSWTFRDLRRAAGRVAAVLAERGLVPGDRVGILAGRSPEAIAAFLGTLEAGCSYVPLDPEYPEDRRAFMLVDSGSKLVLADAGAPPLVGVGAGLPRVTFDRVTLFAERDSPDGPVLRGGSAGSPASHPGGIAYVLYTSGTTGRPKGVAIPHRALSAHAAAITREFGLSADDRVYQFAAAGFDLFGEEIYPTLAAGATLHLRPEGVTPTPEELVRTLGEHRLSVCNVPTPLWHEWATGLAASTAPGLAPPEGLRLVIVGTEISLPERLAAWRDALSARSSREGVEPPRWINAYGPTEATITTTTFSPGPETPRLQRVPIGRPLEGVRVRVLDRAGRLAGLGVPGELCLGGDQLALGYLGRPAGTAAAFVPDPYPPRGREGARLYRTGDLVRQLPGGDLEFLGRTDDQVKVRGFRIEPGEVESALDAHPGVREVAVVPIEAGPGDVRLVAYVAGDEGRVPSRDELAGFLGERLPPYMVPAAFVFLAALPLTPAGKVDRKALPAPEWSAEGGAFVAPRGPLEELVAGVWSEVLGIETPGARDDFFRLGGHSLLATRVVSRLRDRLGVEVPLRRLFEAPTVEGLARVVAELRRGEGRGGAAALPPVVRRPEGEEVPASFAQQRLWFLDRLEPGSVLYNMAFRIDLGAEDLDEAALSRAIGEIVRRHESLRTTFERRGEIPLQVIHPATPPEDFELPVVDLSEREAAAAALEEARTPFDLAAGPLARFRLLRLPEGRSHLLFTAHHAVSDGWSTDLFLAELAALYRAYEAGEEPSLPEPPIQYGDYAVWQRRWLDGDALAALADHWRGALAGAPALLELPTDRPRPPVPSGDGGRVAIALSRESTEEVEALARRLGATPFMVLLTAWAAVLARWSGQYDVPVGTPIAGRSRSELEGLIGFFANTLAIRADLREGDDGPPSFAGAVARVREASLAAYAHQELPFEKLVEELQPERSLAHHPIFQVFFAFHPPAATAAGAPEEGGLRPRLLANDNRTARFDLALNLWGHGGRTHGFLEYATDLFDRPTAARMTEHLRVLLDAAAAAPESPVRDLPLLTAAERAMVVEEWNATAAPFPAGATLPELAAAQAARTPERTALVVGSQHLSYAEVDRRARLVAERLRRGGVKRDGVVGVCMERSAEMVLALLGVQRAGAAYLPLDPKYPAERLAFVLADAGVRTVLTREETLASEAGDALRDAEAEVVALDGPGWSWRGEGSEEQGAEGAPPLPGSAAYVIYTSGSTGKPKGVVVPHRGIVNRLVWMQRAYGLDASDRVLHKTPYGFDVSVWEFFWPLLAGACLVVADPGRHGDAAYLARTVARDRITTLHFVPSMLQVYLEHPGAAEPPGPRRVIASGEALPPSLARRFAERLPGSGLHNLYGPTEASVDVTVHECRDESASTVPIGRPIDNLRVYVLDPRGRPSPVGVPGELHLAGVGLARGYLGRPALTADRFTPDGVSGASGERLYRTGDLCRALPGGEIEFLGRLDFQVKLRGLRIELGEIEAALAGHPGVREAVVTAPVDAAGDARLVAYAVASGEAPAEEELRRHLARTLPEHMVPSVLLFLDELPLSANGKVDRRALPVPEAGGAKRGEHVAPRNATESRLAALWAEVLGVERVGVHDDFFQLGGHSLKATQVMTRVEEVFGFEVPLRAIFEAPTVARLAERVAELELETLDASALTEALDEIDNLSEDELAALLAADDSELSE